MRLVGTNNSLPNEGRVEILLNEEWGTICDDLFDINDAHVICRLLGYSKAYAAIIHAQFGQGTGKIWFDDLRCHGNETSLFSCPHGGIGVHNCGHYEDVGVICQPTQSVSQLEGNAFKLLTIIRIITKVMILIKERRSRLKWE